MDATALNETAFVLLTLVGVMGAWDGLVRRHIRVTNDPTRLYVSIRGQAAALVGVVCLFLTIGGAVAWVRLVGSVVSACHAANDCVLRHAVLAPLSSWQTGFLTVAGLIAFILWVLGASDLRGPYRKLPIGRGIWIDEKELVRLANQRFAEQGLPAPADDVILRTARLVRQDTALLGLFSQRHVYTAGRVDQHKLTDMTAAMRATDRDTLSPEVRRVLIGTILDYYHEVYRRRGGMLSA